jgi:hypothetical protein
MTQGGWDLSHFPLAPATGVRRIVRILERRPTGATAWFSVPAYLDWQANSTLFEQIAALQQGLATMTSAGEAVPLRMRSAGSHRKSPEGRFRHGRVCEGHHC